MLGCWNADRGSRVGGQRGQGYFNTVSTDGWMVRGDAGAMEIKVLLASFL